MIKMSRPGWAVLILWVQIAPPKSFPKKTNRRESEL
jgi:hypothetical protein